MAGEAEKKICRACFKEKHLTEFYFRKETQRHKNVCKKCIISGKNIKGQENKLCKHCNTPKPISEFYKAGNGKWLQPYCKTCDAIRKDKHRNDNIQIYRNRALKQYYKKRVLKPRVFKKDDVDYIKARRIAYSNRAEVKIKKKEHDKKYRQLNHDKIKIKKQQYKKSGRALIVAKAWQAKQKGNIEFITKKRLRGRIYVALKREIKSESTMSLLGCSVDFFKMYFQSLFTEGMTWEKYMDGEIVIDHIKPCKKFDLTDPNQQKECFHYSNLQPLWDLDNLKKGTFFDETHPLCQKKLLNP